MSDRSVFIAGRKANVADAVAKGRDILICGAIDSNIPQFIRNHPRVHMWLSTELKGNARGRVIPKSVGVVLFTRWNSHAAAKAIHAQAVTRNIYCSRTPLTTGEIRVVLEPLTAIKTTKEFTVQPTSVQPAIAVPVHTNQVTTPTASVEPERDTIGRRIRPKAPSGSVLGFVLQHGNFTITRRQNIGVEVRRLFDAATKAGVKTTLGSIYDAYRRGRMQHGLWKAGTRAKRGFATAPLGPVPTTAPVAAPVVNMTTTPTPTPTPTPPAAPTEPTAPAPNAPIEQVAKSGVDDAIYFVSESIAALHLVKEQLEKLKTEVQRESTAVAKLRKVREALADLDE